MKDIKLTTGLVAMAGMLCAGLVLPQAARAQVTNWTESQAGTGDWTQGGNWSSGVPTGGGGANVNNGGTAVLMEADGTALSLRIGSEVDASGAVGVLTGGSLAITGGINVGAESGVGTGSLRISGGSVTVGTSPQSNVWKTGEVIVADGGSLDLAWSLVLWDGTLRIGEGAGAGTVTAGGGGLVGGGTDTSRVIFNHTDAAYVLGTQVSNNIEIIHDGSGTTTLTNVTNSYTVATTVNAGKLQAGATNVFGYTSGVTLANTAGAILDLNNFNQTIGALSGGGATGGNVTLGSATLRVGGADTSTTFSGVISGTGGLIKDGTGVLTLAGANTYTGATGVNAGTLRAGAAGAFAVNSAVELGNVPGVSLDLNNFNQTIGSLAGGGATGGDVTLGSATLTVGGSNNSTTFSGIISGTGGLTKEGTGTFTLGGANTYEGGTTVSGGTLQGDTTSLQGDITNNAAVVFNQTADGTYAGDITGTGALTKSGAGVLTFSGTNTYEGGTTVSAGTLQGSTTSLQGDITNNAAVVFAQTVNGTYEGVLSGTGTLTKTGAGVLTLGGVNTYTGATGVNAGTLRTGAAGALGVNSAVTLADVAGAILDLNNFNQTVGSLAGGGTTGGDVTLGSATLTVGGSNNSTTFSGIISGTGGLTKEGTGTFTLGGANTYEGGTTVSGGTLQGDTTSLQGDITNNAAVVFNQTADGTYAGDISGTGTLTKSGAGVLTLAGANTYEGGTTVSAGTLQGSTTSLQGDILNNAAVVFDQADDDTYAGVLSGTGTLTKTGAGVLTLAGANTYEGGTTVSAGALQGSTTSLQGDILNNATVVFDQAADDTYAGVITGTGTLTKTGAGVLTLSGANTYGGGTTVSAGTLQGDTTSLQGGIANEAAVVFEQTADDTYAGVITGTGTLTKTGAGVLTLSGANTYAGGTTVSAGTLQGDATSLQGDIANEATVVFEQAGDGTYEGVLSGNGVFTKTGAGVLTFTGASTYTGATQLDAGSLLVNGSLGDTAVTVASGATLGGSGAITGAVTVQSGGILAAGNSPGTLTVGSLTLDAGSLLKFELDTPGIAGGGVNDLIIVNGDLTLAGVLQLTPLAGFDAGTYQLFNYTGGLAGPGLTFNSQPVAFEYEIDTATAGQVDLLVTRATAQYWDAGLSPSGVAGGAGGDGTWDADSTRWTSSTGNNNNAWTGDLAAIFGGTAGTVTIADGFTASAPALSFLTDGYVIDAAGSGALELTDDAEVEVLAAGVTAEIAAPIIGTAGLFKTGAGTLILSGENTYTGGTVVDGGILQIGDGATGGSVTGDIINSASLVFSRSDDTGFAGAITGSGALTKTGAGVLTLSGASTYGGSTLVKQGVLEVTGSLTHTGGNMIIGDITGDDGALRILAGGTVGGNHGNIANNAGTTGAVTVSGAGSAWTNDGNVYVGRLGDGTLTLADGGTVTVAGLVSVANGAGSTGTLNIGAYDLGAATTAGTLDATAVVFGDGAGVINFNQTDTITFAPAISGAGAVVLRGEGTTLLTGANTYTGGTTVSGGTLQGDATSLQGDIANDATVVFDQAVDGTYAGVLSGSGVFTKTGAGVLTFTGASTYTGATQLDAGSLLVNGSLGDTAVTVASGATLGGSGVITGSVTVQSGGILSPGNSPGLLTVGSLVLEAGSITLMEINGTAVAGVDYDQIHVTGEATLGGTLELILGGGYTPANGDTFVLIDADSITVGSDFAAVNGLGNALVFTTTITDDYTLKITAVQSDFSAFAETPNQLVIAGLLDANWSDPVLSGVVDALNSLPGTSLPGAFDLIAPEEYAAIPDIARHNTRAMWAALRRRLAEVRGGASGWSTAGLGLTDRTAPLLAATGGTGDALARDILAAKQSEELAPRSGFFVSGSGTFGGEDAGNAPGYDFQTGSLLVGADANLTPDLALGVMAGYGHTRADPDSGGSITIETARAGFYGTLAGDAGGWLNASAGGAYHWHDTRRVALGGVATAAPEAAELNAALELGRDFTKDGWTFTPAAGLGYMLVDMEGFAESGSLAPVAVSSQTSESLRGELAATLSRRVRSGGNVWEGWARLGVAHEFLDTQTAVRARLLSGGGGAFSVTGNRTARDSVVFATGLQVTLDEATVAALGYSGDYNPDYRTHSVNASLRIRF